MEENSFEEKNKKIMQGLEMAYAEMIQFKRYKKTPLVISENGKVVKIDPEKAPSTTTYHFGNNDE